MRNNKGFSLVELIVVIAIMAVLAAVAVIGVSIYVPRAQQAADKQLVSDVEQALNLYYQSHAGNMTGGYVIISTSGTQASGDAAQAMNDVFGEGQWEGNKLAFDNWNSNVNALMNMVAGYEDAKYESIAGSSFLNSNMSTDGMLGAVGDLLGMTSGAISADTTTQEGRDSTLEILRTLGVKEATLDKLRAIPLEDGDGFKTAASNALVGCYSGKIDEAYSKGENEKVDEDGLTKLMCFYANAYAYQEAMKGTEKEAEAKEFYTAVGDAIAKVEAEGLEAHGLQRFNGGSDAVGYKALECIGVNEIWKQLLGVVGNADLWDGYKKDFVDTQVASNNDTALKNMMGAVSSVAQNAQDLTNENLFTSPEIKNQVDAYRYAVQLREALDDLPTVNDNDIVIFLLEDGTIFSTVAIGD